MRAIAWLMLGSTLTAVTTAAPQPSPAPGSRVVTLRGFGDYYRTGPDGRAVAVSPDGLGVNIVAGVDHVAGDRIYIRASGSTEPAGWVPAVDAIPLDDAIRYFTARLDRDATDWDAFLRRAEAEHALNLRDAAIADYTRAIALAPREPFLYLRRGRSRRVVGDCRGAAADFEQAFLLRADWPEPSNQAAGIYADCPDPGQRDPKKAIALAKRALDLDVGHPTYLTTLALAYFRDGQLERAIATQREALAHPLFPKQYRAGAEAQLRLYEAATPKP
jgi:tetratricopeptide (TPR) repeat protein